METRVEGYNSIAAYYNKANAAEENKKFKEFHDITGSALYI